MPTLRLTLLSLLAVSCGSNTRVDGGTGGGFGNTGGGSGAGGGGGSTVSIGTCATVNLDGLTPISIECPATLPMTNLGGTLISGTYRLTTGILSPRYAPADGGCSAPDSTTMSAFRVRLAATNDARRYDYEAVRGYIDGDGGVFGLVGSERGVAQVTEDGLSIAFIDVTCSDAGTNILSSEPRLFIASSGRFSTDCCRSSVDGGWAVSSNDTYMLEFTRED